MKSLTCASSACSVSPAENNRSANSCTDRNCSSSSTLTGVRNMVENMCGNIRSAFVAMWQPPAQTHYGIQRTKENDLFRDGEKGRKIDEKKLTLLPVCLVCSNSTATKMHDNWQKAIQLKRPFFCEMKQKKNGEKINSRFSVVFVGIESHDFTSLTIPAFIIFETPRNTRTHRHFFFECTENYVTIRVMVNSFYMTKFKCVPPPLDDATCNSTMALSS